MKRLFVALALISAITASALVPVASSSALEIECTSDDQSQCNLVKQKGLQSQVWNIVSVALRALAGIAVIVIIIGGIMYASSSGDASKINAAKNTILYAVIGLVVALLSTAIIATVNRFFT